MTHSMIVWSGIIVVIVLAFVLRAMEKCHHIKDFRKRHIHWIEMAKEEEMFYCPGDENKEEEMFYCPGDENMEEKDDSEN